MPTRRPVQRSVAFVVFVDMLGFQALTEKHPHRLQKVVDLPITATSTTLSSNQFGKFHQVVEWAVSRPSDNALISAMAFSDCAFFAYSTAVAAAQHAARMMQKFIWIGVPIRMGLSHGSFYPFKFGSDTQGSFTFTRAAFYGTAIVRAHQAESYKDDANDNKMKGCRIFVHRGVKPRDRDLLNRGARILPMPEGSRVASHELCYLHPDEPAESSKPTCEDQDQELWRSFNRIRDALLPPRAPAGVKLQYAATVDALNRMRKSLGRPIFT